MHSAKTVFPLDTQETRRGGGAIKKCLSIFPSRSHILPFSLSLSLSVLNALQSLYLPQGACPFFYFSLLSACSVILTQLCVYIRVCMYVCVCVFFVNATEWEFIYRLLFLLLLLIGCYCCCCSCWLCFCLFCFRVTVRVLLFSFPLCFL